MALYREWCLGDNYEKIILGVCVILILCLSISRCAMNNKDNKQDIPEQIQDSVNLTEEADSSSSFLDEEELEDEAFTESFKGRGKGHKPEEYIGLVGYAALEKGYDIHDYTLIEHWEIPTYQQDKQFWVETGALPHKTKVVVKEQLLENTSRCGYSGYLLVERSDTGEQVYINVKDFVTTPYWLSDDLVQAVRYGFPRNRTTINTQGYSVKGKLMIKPSIFSYGRNRTIISQSQEMTYRGIDVDRADFFQIHTYISYMQHLGTVKFAGLLYSVEKDFGLLNTSTSLYNLRDTCKFIADGPVISKDNIDKEHFFEVIKKGIM